tara:strand:+ start:199 stop:522 length:324 start_codon:yes stop_codon:yes gene_type:complete
MRALLESYGMVVKDYASAHLFLLDVPKYERGCLVLDNHMPGMTGIELLQLLRDRNDPLPVVIITGSGDPFLRERAERAGAIAVLEKPIDDEKLIPLVRNVLQTSWSL